MAITFGEDSLIREAIFHHGCEIVDSFLNFLEERWNLLMNEFMMVSFISVFEIL